MHQNKPTKPCGPAGFLLRVAAVLIATAAVLFALLFAAYCLPGEPVRQNIARSVPLLQREGLYPEYFGFKLFQMDNYTDTLMLFEAASADETDPLTAMMTNTAYNVDNFTTLPDDLAAYLTARQAGGGAGGLAAAGLTPFCYARYWHGYLIWLRPLLAVTTYGGVRVVQYLVLACLLAAVLGGLWRRCGKRAALWFLASQLLVSVFFVPHQVQFFTCFAVGYAGCLWVLRAPRQGCSLALALVCLGACTAFCDLLVTPIVTLGLPVTVWLLCPAPGGTARAAARCGAVLGGSLCWGAGYGLCWALKWVLAGAVTGQDILGDAIRQAGVRTTAATWHGMELTWGNLLRFCYDTLNSRGLFWPALAAGLLALAWVCLCVRDRAALWAAAPFALCALMAPAWFAVLRTHSVQHGWFTWRAICVTLLALPPWWRTACHAPTGLARLRRLRPHR